MADEENRLRLEPVEDLAPEVEDDVDATAPMRVVKVHNGDSLTIGEADAYLRRQRAKVISFIGCPDSGKTTASVMLYELAKRGRLGELGFVGSATIRGFQERAHLSLVSSGKKEPDTQRTSAKAATFLQLTFGNATNRYSVLMCDRSGEDFEKCLSTPTLMGKFPEIARADCHILLVDGAKLMDLDVASLHLSQVQRLALALVKCKALTAASRVQIALTKYDKIEGKPIEKHVVEIFDSFAQQIHRDISPICAISAIRLSSRPTEMGQQGESLREMAADWFKEEAKSSFELKIPPVSVDFKMADRLNRKVFSI